MNTYGNEISSLLKRVRKHYKYTLVYVSKMTGIAEETLRRLESDKFEPKLSTLNILSDFYRIDLVELYSRKRGVGSLFSEEFIKAFNTYLRNTDYEGLKLFSQNEIEKIKQSDLKNKSSLVIFLNTICQTKYKTTGSQIDTIANLESLITSINSNYLNENDQNYPLPIEVTSIILLSILYRQSNNNNASILLIQNTIRRIKMMPFLNDRYLDYLATLYLNLSYSYHYQNMNYEVINTINEVFHDNVVVFTGYEMFNYLFRLGIALFKNNDNNYLPILQTAVYTIPINERDKIYELLKSEYQIEITRL